MFCTLVFKWHPRNNVHAPTCQVAVAKLNRVGEELKRLCKEEIRRPLTQPMDWLSNMLVKEKQNGKRCICIDPNQKPAIRQSGQPNT